jgi:hypothetical protein
MTACVAATIVLGGCASPFMRVEPASTAECDTSKAERCEIQITRNDASGKYSCGLGKFDVKPDLLVLKGGQPVDITWTLSSGFGFCGGDGVEFPWGSGGAAQVWDSFRATREGPGPRTPETRKACLPTVTLGWANKLEGTFSYLLLFHTTVIGPTLCRIDPWIKNG